MSPAPSIFWLGGLYSSQGLLQKFYYSPMSIVPFSTSALTLAQIESKLGGNYKTKKNTKITRSIQDSIDYCMQNENLNHFQLKHFFDNLFGNGIKKDDFNTQLSSNILNDTEQIQKYALELDINPQVEISIGFEIHCNNELNRLHIQLEKMRMINAFIQSRKRVAVEHNIRDFLKP